RQCICAANARCACPICRCSIFGSRPLVHSRDNFRRPGTRPRRCCGLTPLSQLKAGNVWRSSRTPRMPTILSTGYAKRGCRRVGVGQLTEFSEILIAAGQACAAFEPPPASALILTRHSLGTSRHAEGKHVELQCITNAEQRSKSLVLENPIEAKREISLKSGI